MEVSQSGSSECDPARLINPTLQRTINVFKRFVPIWAPKNIHLNGMALCIQTQNLLISSEKNKLKTYIRNQISSKSIAKQIYTLFSLDLKIHIFIQISLIHMYSFNFEPLNGAFANTLKYSCGVSANQKHLSARNGTIEHQREILVPREANSKNFKTKIQVFYLTKKFDKNLFENN